MRLPAARALERIQKGSLASGYWLVGREVYWRDRVWEALRDAMGREMGDMGVSEFDLRHDSVDRVLERARTNPLLVSRQLILVRNAQAAGSRRRRESGDSDSSRARSASALTAYSRDPNPSTILVFEMMDVDLESADWREKEKTASRLEALEGFGEVVLLDSPNVGQAVEWVCQEAAQRKKKISPQVAEQLVLAGDRNMARIRLELEKLCLYDAQKEIIDSEEVSLLATDLVAGTDMSLADAIGSRRGDKVLEALAGLFRTGKYPPLIVSEVARYLRQLILLKEKRVQDARQAGRLLWAARLPAPQSAFPSLVRQARAFSLGQLLAGLRLAFEADLALRSSPPSEQIILERFLLKLIKPLPPKP